MNDLFGNNLQTQVGTSGSGKSTILRLLCRFYDPDRGTVAVGGAPLPDISLASLRRHVGVVPQDTVLFNESIFYNIKYGRMDATEQEVYQAAKQAAIHNVVMRLPNGYVLSGLSCKICGSAFIMMFRCLVGGY